MPSRHIYIKADQAAWIDAQHAATGLNLSKLVRRGLELAIAEFEAGAARPPAPPPAAPAPEAKGLVATPAPAAPVATKAQVEEHLAELKTDPAVLEALKAPEAPAEPAPRVHPDPAMPIMVATYEGETVFDLLDLCKHTDVQYEYAMEDLSGSPKIINDRPHVDLDGVKEVLSICWSQSKAQEVRDWAASQTAAA